MPQTFTPGQSLKITNPDWHVISEDYAVVTVAYPTLTFLCTKYFLVDTAGIHYFGTETVVGTVIKNDDTEAIIAFVKHPPPEVGLRVQGNRATYLLRLDPAHYA